MHSFSRQALAPLSSPNLSTIHKIETTLAPNICPFLHSREGWGILEGLLVLTALAVGSLPAVALAAIAPRPEDAHALVHAGVGLAQVHRASGFCNRHRAESRLRHVCIVTS